MHEYDATLKSILTRSAGKALTEITGLELARRHSTALADSSINFQNNPSEHTTLRKGWINLLKASVRRQPIYNINKSFVAQGITNV